MKYAPTAHNEVVENIQISTNKAKKINTKTKNCGIITALWQD